MFHWNRQTRESKTIKDELLTVMGARKVRIATAFLSSEGASTLEEMKQTYKLKNTDITLYLSAEFSSDKPHEILKRLADICIVKIIFERTFHPKVYMINGTENKLLFGSSNFTLGGLQNNVEFNYIGIPSTQELSLVDDFFEYCEKMAISVDDDIIDFYAANASELEKAKNAQRKIRAKLHGFHKKDDAFSESDYAIENYYFTYEDYETFFIRNQALNDKGIRIKRQKVQEKMLKIHSRVYPQIKKMGIACHKRPDNITSLIIPCLYNHHVVAWNGVRYGKTPSEIDLFNLGGDKDDMYGFQKHGCLQYAIGSSGFEINLFLAVKHDAWDRAHMHEKLNILRPNIEKELKELRGYGLEWVIYDSNIGEEFIFDVDNEETEAFCDYFSKYDCDGHELFLRCFYELDHELLEDFNSICDEVVSMIEWLLPLYNTMVNRPKGKY